MSDTAETVRAAQLAFVTAHVRALDPTVADAAIARYLGEIEIMAEALAALPAPDDAAPKPFTAAWTSEAGS
ncbi:MAG: hypothetical protein KC442_13010 [Thermomicrobiales bacterium]|nr:hypothetical protein [Thermomicrobiales bacterium]